MHSTRMHGARLLTVSRGSTEWEHRGGGDHVTCDACWEVKPPPVDRQTSVKTLPCTQLRLRTVMK